MLWEAHRHWRDQEASQQGTRAGSWEPDKSWVLNSSQFLHSCGGCCLWCHTARIPNHNNVPQAFRKQASYTRRGQRPLSQFQVTFGKTFLAHRLNKNRQLAGFGANAIVCWSLSKTIVIAFQLVSAWTLAPAFCFLNNIDLLERGWDDFIPLLILPFHLPSNKSNVLSWSIEFGITRVPAPS